MFELNVRAGKGHTCRFQDAEIYRNEARLAAKSVKAKRIILLVHGFNTKAEGARRVYEQIARTWAGNLTDDTVIGAYSWPSSLAGGGPVAYHAARRRTKEAGRRLAELIAALSSQGVEVSVMGHSLGTVVMGHAAVCVKRTIGRASLWDRAVFQAGDARVSHYRKGSDFGRLMLELTICVRNYFAKSDSVLQLSKLALNGKRIGRHALVQPGWSNVDAQEMHGGRVNHTTYKGSEKILVDALTFLQ